MVVRHGAAERAVRRVATAASGGRAGARRGAPRRRARATAAGPVGHRPGRAARRARRGAPPAPAPAGSPVCTPTCTRPRRHRRRCRRSPRGRSRRVARARAPRPSSSNTTTASANPRPGPGGLGQRQGEDAGLAERCPVAAAMACSWPSRARRCSSGSRPASMSRMPSASSRWSSPTRKSISGPWAGRGSARPRCCAAPAMFPAAMVRRDRLEPRVQLLRVAERGPIGTIERVRAQRGPVEHLDGEVAECLRVLGERQLEDGATDAGDAGLCRFRDVALGERPQGVEDRHQVADPPHQPLVAEEAEPVGDGRTSPSSRTHSSSSPTKAVPARRKA